jgi:hypothetical protein
VATEQPTGDLTDLEATPSRAVPAPVPGRSAHQSVITSPAGAHPGAHGCYSATMVFRPRQSAWSKIADCGAGDPRRSPTSSRPRRHRRSRSCRHSHRHPRLLRPSRPRPDRRYRPARAEPARASTTATSSPKPTRLRLHCCHPNRAQPAFPTAATSLPKPPRATATRATRSTCVPTAAIGQPEQNPPAAQAEPARAGAARWPAAANLTALTPSPHATTGAGAVPGPAPANQTAPRRPAQPPTTCPPTRRSPCGSPDAQPRRSAALSAAAATPEPRAPPASYPPPSAPAQAEPARAPSTAATRAARSTRVPTPATNPGPSRTSPHRSGR